MKLRTLFVLCLLAFAQTATAQIGTIPASLPSSVSVSTGIADVQAPLQIDEEYARFVTQGSVSSVLIVATPTEDFEDVGFFSGQNMSITAAPAQDASNTEYNGLAVGVSTSGSQDILDISSFIATASHQGTGELGDIWAAEFGTAVNGDVGNRAYGIDSTLTVSSGTTPMGIGIRIRNRVGENIIPTVVSDLRGLFVDGSIITSGSPDVTAAYGVYIADQTVAAATTNYSIDVNGKFRVLPDGSGVNITEVAFASLPASRPVGTLANVSNSNTAVWGANVAGGGTDHILARWNGTNWTVVGK